MEVIQDEAVVMKRFPFAERDLIVHVLSRNHGVISLMVKGGLHSKRFGGTFEPANELTFEARRRGNSENGFYLLAGVQLHTPISELAFRQLELWSLIQVFLEFAQTIFRDKSDPDLYLRFIASLKRIHEFQPSWGLALGELLSFLVGFLMSQGFLMDPEHCQKCHKTLTSSWSLGSSFEPICNQCSVVGEEKILELPKITWSLLMSQNPFQVDLSLSPGTAAAVAEQGDGAVLGLRPGSGSDTKSGWGYGSDPGSGLRSGSGQRARETIKKMLPSLERLIWHISMQTTSRPRRFESMKFLESLV